jgi:hypothetical protein
MKQKQIVIVGVVVLVVVVFLGLLLFDNPFVGQAINSALLPTGAAGSLMTEDSFASLEDSIEIPVYANIISLLQDKNAYTFSFNFIVPEELTYFWFTPNDGVNYFQEIDESEIMVAGFSAVNLGDLIESGMVKLGTLTFSSKGVEGDVIVDFTDFYILDEFDNNLISEIVDAEFELKKVEKKWVQGQEETFTLAVGEEVDYSMCGWDFEVKLDEVKSSGCLVYVYPSLGGYTSSWNWFHPYGVFGLNTEQMSEDSCNINVQPLLCEDVCNPGRAVLRENLLGYWPLDDLVWDNGYGGDVVNDYVGEAVGISKNVLLAKNGKVNNALRFTGGENFIEINLPDYGSRLSLDLWLKVEGTNEQTIFEIDNGPKLLYVNGVLSLSFDEESVGISAPNDWFFVRASVNKFGLHLGLDNMESLSSSVDINVNFGQKIRFGLPLDSSSGFVIGGFEGYMDEIVLLDSSDTLIDLCLATGMSLIANPEICDNKVDDNEDGLIDCADSLCDNAEFKIKGFQCYEGASREIVCDDGLDNDDNGLTDCFDSACINDPGCIDVETKCNDLSDNDGDGKIDCTDTDCQSETEVDSCIFKVEGAFAKKEDGTPDTDKQFICTETGVNSGVFERNGEICCWSDNECDLGNKEQCIDSACVKSKEAEWQCDDGYDNDESGGTDCEDISCLNFIPTPEHPTNGEIPGDLLAQGIVNVCNDLDMDGWLDLNDPCPSQQGTEGNGCPNTDFDADEIADDADNCPTKPNSNQLDTDGDGIGNVCDLCPNKEGSSAEICPGDDDFDGVSNDDDQCPYSAKGTKVGVTGCLAKEWQCDNKFDDNGNGEVDCDDSSCKKFVPTVEHPTNGNVGSAAIAKGFFNVCDDWDGDGLIYFQDSCPLVAGDENGCPSGDDDNDGVNNLMDECPNTPKDESVDDKGCLDDVDKDGVINKFDKCPGTLEGAVIDKDGCSSGQTPIKCVDVDGDGYDNCDIGTPGDDGKKIDCKDKNAKITICSQGYVCQEFACVSQLCGTDVICQESEFFVGDSLDVNACGVDYNIKVTSVTDTCNVEIGLAEGSIDAKIEVEEWAYEDLIIDVQKISAGSCQLTTKAIGCEQCVDDTVLIQEINKWLSSNNANADADLIKSINLWLANPGTSCS